jgi:serine protease
MPAKNCFRLLLCLFLFQFSQVSAQSGLISWPESANFADKKIILKAKSIYRNQCSMNDIGIPALIPVFNSLGTVTLQKKFPLHQSPTLLQLKNNPHLVDLSLIYELTFNESIALKKAMVMLLATNVFEYAEPLFIPKPLYNPNDPEIALQYHLGKIEAFQAWDINTGDTNVVVGITDTGVDLLHPDLAGNIKINTLDPVDGADNDLDGYVDNYQGWDLGENDNSPQCNANFHGLHVAGLSSAITDNSIGIAGSGFKCKMLPVKISDAGGALTAAYDGIVYAADHGCQIINCSWGGTGGGQYGQDIVNYAVYNKNSTVIAAAGNDGNDERFYPATFANVLNVSASDQNDHKKANSNYGTRIDVIAPGEDMYSTWINGTYTASGGTSTAAPLVAGAAAIVKSFFPTYNALQIGEQLKATSDIVDTIGANLPYQGLLGRGRINLYRALTETNHPSIVLTGDSLYDNNDLSLVANDTIRLSGYFTNYLSATDGVTLQITNPSAFLQILNGSAILGSMNTLETKNNHNNPFTLVILPGAPFNEKIEIPVTISDTSGSLSIEYFTIVINVDYINVQINEVATSITSKGNFGFNPPGQSQGLGFQFNNQNLLYEGGLMISAGVSKVSDVVRGSGAVPDTDFSSVQNIAQIIPGIDAEFDANGIFSDAQSLNPIPVTIIQKGLAWSQPGNDHYVALHYDIINSGSSTIDSVYAGIFTDWDIMNSSMNKSSEDQSLKLGYTFSTQANGLYAGVQLLSWTAPFWHYALDNISGGAGAIDLTNGFSTTEKFQSMSQNRPNAGQGTSGNDVCDVVATGPFQLLPGDTAKIAFAILAGNSLTEIQTAATNAQILFGTQPVGGMKSNEDNASISIYPNPTNNRLIISSIENRDIALLEIINVLGNRIECESINQKNRIDVNVSQFSTGIYFANILNGTIPVVVKFVVE